MCCKGRGSTPGLTLKLLPIEGYQGKPSSPEGSSSLRWRGDTCARTRTCTHRYRHAHLHTHTHSHLHTSTYRLAVTPDMHFDLGTPTHLHADSLLHLPVHSHSNPQPFTHTHLRSHIHMHTRLMETLPFKPLGKLQSVRSLRGHTAAPQSETIP